MTGTDDVKLIEGVIQCYLDGLYENDAGKLASAFHPTSALTSVTDDGELVITPRDAWLDRVRARPSPQQQGLQRHDQVLAIDLVSPTMAATRTQAAITSSIQVREVPRFRFEPRARADFLRRLFI